MIDNMGAARPTVVDPAAAQVAYASLDERL